MTTITFTKRSYMDGDEAYDVYYDSLGEFNPRQTKRSAVATVLKKHLGIDGSISSVLHYKDMLKVAQDKGIYIQFKEN